MFSIEDEKDGNCDSDEDDLTLVARSNNFCEKVELLALEILLIRIVMVITKMISILLLMKLGLLLILTLFVFL